MKLIPYFLLGIFICFKLFADDDTTIKYQGKLVEGSSLVNRTVEMVFRIYTNAVAGDYVYEETNSVVVANGFYSTIIGKNANYGQLKKALKYPNSFIQVIVNGTALWPREKFLAPPFAKESAEHWNMFVYTAFSGPGVYDYKISRTNLLTYSAYKNLNFCTPEFPGSMSMISLIFPPNYTSKEIVSFRLYCSTKYYNGGVDPLKMFIRIRSMYSDEELRRLVDGVACSNIPARVWHEIPLNGQPDFRTINPGEYLEVCLRGDDIEQTYYDYYLYNIFFDVLVQ